MTPNTHKRGLGDRRSLAHLHNCLAHLVLFLEEHQLQTPVCAGPCSGGCPGPWQVGAELLQVFCSDKALAWGKDTSVLFPPGQPSQQK